MLPSYFRQAIKASSFSDHRVKLGACVFVKGTPVSVGYNQRFKTHPLTRKFNEHQTIHAEVAAIIRIRNKSLLKGSTMVVFRGSNIDGSPLIAKPCPTCQSILKFFGISKVVYTTNGGYEEMDLTP
jgi:tRNA(Arg) A34 adenosine deaminase TadA